MPSATSARSRRRWRSAPTSSRTCAARSTRSWTSAWRGSRKTSREGSQTRARRIAAGKNLETFGFDGAGGVRAKNVNAVSFEPTLDYTRRALRLLRAALFFRRDDAELFSRAAAAFASAAGERLVRDVVLGAATWSASGGARFAADADALTGVFGAYGISGRRRGGRGGGVTRRKPAFYAQLATLREAKALLSLDVDAARAFAKTIENGGEASVMDAREKHGVHRSDDDRVRDVILRMV